MLAVAVAALAVATASGLDALRPGLPVWIAGGVFLALVLLSVSYPHLRDEPYDWQARLVSALKFCEYAALAVAVPLLVRGRDDARVAFRAIVCWSVVATTVGVLQFVGAVDQMLGHRPAVREPSLLGYHDFAALSGASIALAVVTLAVAGDDLLGRPWMIAAFASGGLGIVASGAMTGVIGMWLAIAALVLVARTRALLTRRVAVILATVGALVTLGTAGMRGTALRDFASFLGIHRNETPGAVESYAQRTVLALHRLEDLPHRADHGRRLPGLERRVGLRAAARSSPPAVPRPAGRGLSLTGASVGGAEPLRPDTRRPGPDRRRGARSRSPPRR